MFFCGLPSLRCAVSSLRDEFSLIDWVRRHVAAHPRVTLGIGDDAAVLRFPQPTDCLVTVDMLMEGTDFLLPSTKIPSTFPASPSLFATPQQIGYKSLAVNLSDIAAMAGKPLAAVVAVALPLRGGFELAQGIHEGMQPLAAQFGVALAGGDTNTWDGPLVISVTVMGEATGSGPVKRSGAKPGDWVMATGSFGGSITGRHLSLTPRVEEALALHRTVELHSMIDVSDGLAADLRHILEESHVGAILDETSIPICAAARQLTDGRSPLEHALGDGEDFELLFTVSPTDGARLLSQPPFKTPLSHIGEISSGSDYLLRDASGKITPLPVLGWKHGFE